MNLNEIVNEFETKYNIDTIEIVSSFRELVVILLAHIKNVTRADIKLGNVEFTETDKLALDIMLKKVVIDKIPIEYLTNTVNIYNETYYVDNRVLVPRQDTETLIEESINCITENNLKTGLDMCTGSGVVGISISKNSCIEKVDLVDISQDALDVAKINITKNNANKCNLINSDMFENLYEINTRYDIIVSNPPYLTIDELESRSEYLKKEPTLAFYGGEDGIRFYEIIFETSRDFLNNNGYILVEIGYEEKEKVLSVISKYPEYTDVETIQDINSKDRVIKCRFQKV